MKLIVKTFDGIEELLSNELELLGAASIEQQRRVVNCEGDKETLYKICYRSRLAIRVMVSLKEFPAVDEDDVYKQVRSIDWHEYFKPGSTFCLDHVSFCQAMPDSQFVAQKVREAIEDEMMDAVGERVYLNADDPDYMVNVHLNDERVSVSLDAVGAPLDRRGYRPEGFNSVTNEVLAAALVDLSGWKPTQTLIDPMCGAGTICIEAAMKARKIPAAFYRKYAFCFENFKDFDEELWKKVKNEADEMMNHLRLSIIGTDIDTDATDIAKTSTLEMKLTTDVRINRRSLREQTRMTQEGVIVTCPPTDPEETRCGLPDFYKEATYHLSHNFPDYDVWIYSTDAEALDAIPFDAEKELKVRDGFFNLYPF